MYTMPNQLRKQRQHQLLLQQTLERNRPNLQTPGRCEMPRQWAPNTLHDIHYDFGSQGTMDGQNSRPIFIDGSQLQAYSQPMYFSVDGNSIGGLYDNMHFAYHYPRFSRHPSDSAPLLSNFVGPNDMDMNMGLNMNMNQPSQLHFIPQVRQQPPNSGPNQPYMAQQGHDFIQTPTRQSQTRQHMAMGQVAPPQMNGQNTMQDQALQFNQPANIPSVSQPQNVQNFMPIPPFNGHPASSGDMNQNIMTLSGGPFSQHMAQAQTTSVQSSSLPTPPATAPVSENEPSPTAAASTAPKKKRKTANVQEGEEKTTKRSKKSAAAAEKPTPKPKRGRPRKTQQDAEVPVPEDTTTVTATETVDNEPVTIEATITEPAAVEPIASEAVTAQVEAVVTEPVVESVAPVQVQQPTPPETVTAIPYTSASTELITDPEYTTMLPSFQATEEEEQLYGPAIDQLESTQPSLQRAPTTAEFDPLPFMDEYLDEDSLRWYQTLQESSVPSINLAFDDEIAETRTDQVTESETLIPSTLHLMNDPTLSSDLPLFPFDESLFEDNSGMEENQEESNGLDDNGTVAALENVNRSVDGGTDQGEIVRQDINEELSWTLDDTNLFGEEVFLVDGDWMIG